MQHTKIQIRIHVRTATITILTVLIVACASTSKKQAMQTEIDGLREQIQQIQKDVPETLASVQSAQAAAGAATEAAIAAQVAAKQSLAAAQESESFMEASNEKIDRVFKRSMSDGGEAYTIVRVFYATDRNATATPTLEYRTGRSPVTYGICDVSIPNDHELGEMESPKWWRFELREDPKKHIVFRGIQKQEPDQFFAHIKARIAASSGKNAFVFVHGYNSTFEDAAKRTAQITYDLKFEGAPVFYSWPSMGTIPGYPVDEANVEWATHDLEMFLGDFLNRTNVDNVYLIAHSMGTRALTRAFENLVKSNPSARKKIREIILAAPDIDADVFKRDIAPKLTGTANQRTTVTLYASSRDRALNLSKDFHGYPRAGDSADQIVLANGIDTIDASAVDTGFMGHSYFGATRSVLEDIYALINGHQRACHRFGMTEIQSTVGKYCTLRP
jgi:esterase/lipase superfamily enzyme